MAFDLPRVHVRTDSFDPVIVELCPEVDRELAERLAQLDRGTVPTGTVDRCVPLSGRSFAIGQRRGDDTLWRIVGPEDAEQLSGNPAWLWTSEAWFDPALGRAARARAATPTPLRQLVRMMAPLGGRNRRTVKALAAVVASLRTPGAGPVAVLVERDLLTSASHPARWFALALLTILPPGRRDSIRISIGESNPSPSGYDLVITPDVPTGFVTVDATDPPDEGDDLVAYYVRNRLNDDDPEALEAAAYLFDGDGDRWGDGIAALIRDGLPGVSEVTDATIDEDPERAVAALAARLRAGAPMEASVLEQLVRVTVRTHDPRPWRALARRPPLQRADAIDALLTHTPTAGARVDLLPSPPLVAALTDLYPRGAPLEVWVPSLLRWLREGVDPEAVGAALLVTLSEWPRSREAPGLLADGVRQLVAVGRTDLAGGLLGSPVAARLVRDGAGAELVPLWESVGSVEPERITTFVEAYRGEGAPGDAPAQVARLLGAVLDREPLARAVVDAWSVDRRAGPDDPVWVAASSSPVASAWRGGPSVVPLSAEVMLDDDSAEHDARQVLVTLSRGGYEALPARASELLASALATAALPDAELSEAAEALASCDGAAPLWGLVAVSAAPPDAFDDDTIDATVVEFCAGRLDSDTIAVASAAFRALGAGRDWEPLDHARWLVRLALAPPGIGNVPLVTALLGGIRQRADGVRFLSGVVAALVELPPDHEASVLLLQQLQAAGWDGASLGRVIETVGPINIPLSFRRTLVAMAESA
ncbi:MAG: hypothetical protein ABMA64_30905 [Myxococcota bacterium]